jgi:histidyl-tRNA synthetase
MSTESSPEVGKAKSSQKPSFQAPRGMHDSFGLEQRKRQFIEATCRRVASVYGYEEISTPLVEDEAVFSRTLGSDSDVVSKEMYTFPDRSGNNLSLRPEGTAGVVRAAINHGRDLGNKLFYTGPMFRYERPQKGRARQVRHI